MKIELIEFKTLTAILVNIKPCFIKKNMYDFASFHELRYDIYLRKAVYEYLRINDKTILSDQ